MVRWLGIDSGNKLHVTKNIVSHFDIENYTKMLVPISLYPEIVIEKSELRPLLILLDSFSDL